MAARTREWHEDAFDIFDLSLALLIAVIAGCLVLLVAA